MFGVGGRGPGNWCSELLDAHNLGVKLSAQWHLASTGAMTSARPVLKSCCDSTDSTGADLRMGSERSTEHCADWNAEMLRYPDNSPPRSNHAERCWPSGWHCVMINCFARRCIHKFVVSTNHSPTSVSSTNQHTGTPRFDVEPSSASYVTSPLRGAGSYQVLYSSESSTLETFLLAEASSPGIREIIAEKRLQGGSVAWLITHSPFTHRRPTPLRFPFSGHVHVRHRGYPKTADNLRRSQSE